MSLELPPFTFNFSPQKGKPGHCMVAQVWDERGNNLAEVEPSADPAYATMICRLFAKSPLLVTLVEQLISTAPSSSRDHDFNFDQQAWDQACATAQELIAELRSVP